MLAYNEFTYQTMLMLPIPGTKTPRSTFRPRELKEPDLMHALYWFNRYGFHKAAKHTIVDAVLTAAREKIVSPVRHYLKGLAWDRDSSP